MIYLYKASIADPRGHTNPCSSPTEAAEAWNTWGTNTNSFTILDSKKIAFWGHGRIKLMQKMRYTIANIVMIKWEAGDQHSTYQLAWNYARTNQWWMCYGMCPAEKSLTLFTLSGPSSLAFLCILDLSVDRLFFPSSPFLLELRSASLPCLLALWLQKNAVYFQADYFHPQAVLAPQDSLLVLLTALETAESQNRGEIDIINYITPKMV